MPETDIIPGGPSTPPTETNVKFVDKLSINNEDDLVLKVAMQLYSYTNFEEVKNLTKQAKLCIERANYFAKAYLEFKHYKPSDDPNAPERLKEDGIVNIY